MIIVHIAIGYGAARIISGPLHFLYIADGLIGGVFYPEGFHLKYLYFSGTNSGYDSKITKCLVAVGVRLCISYFSRFLFLWCKGRLYS
jgi:hypothetical protein